MSGNGGFEQIAVTAGLNERGQQITSFDGCGPLQQTLHRIQRSSQIGLERRIEVMRERQFGVQRKGLPERILGAREVRGLVFHAVLAEETEGSAQAGPRGRVLRVGLD